MKQKSKPANAYNGAILFDGNMTVTLATGEQVKLRMDYNGMELKNADPNKEIIVMMKKYAHYNELQTGFIVKNPKWENGGVPCFGLKPIYEQSNWALHQYWDVIAWGYADGGLNNSRSYSCQCTPEQEAELERQRKEQGITVPEAVSDRYDGTIIRFQLKDGQVGVQIVVDKENIEGYREAAKKWLEPCCKNFQDVTEANPDIGESHYFTKPTTWEE